MGTSMVCTFNQVAPPGDGCQIVRRARWTASALIAPGPAGSVTVPGGSAGNVCQWPPALVMISPLLPVSTTAVAPEAPNDVEVTAAPFSGSGGGGLTGEGGPAVVAGQGLRGCPAGQQGQQAPAGRVHGQRIGGASQGGSDRAERGPCLPAGAGLRERGEGEVLARPERRDQGLPGGG